MENTTKEALLEEHKEQARRNRMGRSRFWKWGTAVFLVLFLFMLYANYYDVPGFEFGGTSEDVAAARAVAYVNENLLAGFATATLVDVVDEGEYYRLDLLITNVLGLAENASLFLSKDGNLLFPTVIDLGDYTYTPEGGISIDEDSVIGNADAPVSIVVYSDFECAICGNAYWVLKLVLEEYGDQVNVVYKNSPDSENALKAAEAGECANQQGKFVEYYDTLYENQGALAVDDLKRYAVELGLDTGAFNTCLDTGVMADEVQADKEEGVGLGVVGIPTFFIGDQKLEGDVGFSDFKEVIDAVLVGSEEEVVVTVGVMLPLSGDAASYGESVKKGIELAVQDIGATNIKLVYEDTKCDGTEAATAINKLISVDGVSAVIGELCSGATLAVAPIAEENQVVMISPASTSPEVTTAGEYIFRTVPSDALQGAFGAGLVFEKGYKNLAILYGNEEYGVGFEEVLRENFEQLGGTVVASEAFERGAVDLGSQLTKIQEVSPDAVYIISTSPDSAVVALEQIVELGITAAIFGPGGFGSEGLKSQDILDDAGSAAEGLMVTSVSSGTREFIEHYEEVYGEEPGPFAAQGYDAFQVIYLAVVDGAVTGSEIQEKLYGFTLDGASGLITFDENGDISGNYGVYVVTDGAFVVSA